MFRNHVAVSYYHIQYQYGDRIWQTYTTIDVGHQECCLHYDPNVSFKIHLHILFSTIYFFFNHTNSTHAFYIGKFELTTLRFDPSDSRVDSRM